MNSLYFILTVVLVMALARPAQGAIAVVSNLALPGEGLQLLKENGSALSAGSQARLGSFGGKTDPEINDAAVAGKEALLGMFRPFGEAIWIGDGAGGNSGSIEASVQEEVKAGGKPAGEILYLLVGDEANLEAANEIAVLKFSNASFPSDMAGGVDSYVASHLRDATVVFGTKDVLGFHTSAITYVGSFEVWIAALLPGAAPADLLPSADPDFDGNPNINEYALGSHPGDASSSATITASNNNGQIYAVFNRRLDEAKLGYTVEGNQDLDLTWTPVAGGVELILNPSPLPPPGYEKVRVPLPDLDWYFARLRIEYSP